eukprot:scaffold51348_cov48-Phaeocystis_antarctica.AAC.1
MAGGSAHAPAQPRGWAANPGAFKVVFSGCRVGFLNVWYMPTKGILGLGLLRSDSQEPFRVHRPSWNYGSTGVKPCSG